MYEGHVVGEEHGVRGTEHRSREEGAREVGSPCEWRGGARHWSRAMVGESGLETC